MNFSFHIPVTWLLVALLGSCHEQQQLTTGTSLAIAVQVKGCAADATKKSPDVVTDPVTPFFSNPFKVAGDTVLYMRTREHLCCRKVRVTGSLQDNTIVIEEKWFGLGCKCKCVSTVNAAVTKLKPGSYKTLVIETGTDPATDQPVSTRDTVWSGTLELK
jgi:hypothetical protein